MNKPLSSNVTNASVALAAAVLALNVHLLIRLRLEQWAQHLGREHFLSGSHLFVRLRCSQLNVQCFHKACSQHQHSSSKRLLQTTHFFSNCFNFQFEGLLYLQFLLQTFIPSWNIYHKVTFPVWIKKKKNCWVCLAHGLQWTFHAKLSRLLSIQNSSAVDKAVKVVHSTKTEWQSELAHIFCVHLFKNTGVLFCMLLERDAACWNRPLGRHSWARLIKK